MTTDPFDSLREANAPLAPRPAFAAELRRRVSLALGATRVRRVEADGLVNAGHIVMQDPEGNEFCLD